MPVASTLCCRILPEKVGPNSAGNAYTLRLRSVSRRAFEGWADFVAANFLIDTALSVLLESPVRRPLNRSDNARDASWRRNRFIGSTPKVGRGAWRPQPLP